LLELDPTTGNTLRSITGRFANSNTPLISDGFIWEFGPGNLASIDSYIYRQSDLSLAMHLPGAVGYSGTTYFGSSGLEDTHYVFDYSAVADTPGLVVYAGTPAPEPKALCGICFAGLLAQRRRRQLW
jgi:hypothetical protein